MPTDKEGIERALRTLPSLPFPLDEERCGAPAVRETAVSGVYRIDLFPRLSGVDAENRCRLYAASPQRAREVFSGEVLAMGREEGALWFVTIHSTFAAEYELCRYRQRTASGRERARLEREAMACALLGAKDESGYFGEWTPPERTPDGGRARYRQADRGVWFVEGGGNWFFAVMRPLLRCMEDEALDLACLNAGPSSPCVFWRLEACAPAVYHLLYDEGREGLRAWITSREDLVNAVWRACPAFARQRQAFAQSVKSVDAGYGKSPAFSGFDFTRTGPGDREFLRKERLGP